MQGAIIFLKELYAVTTLIEHLCKTSPQTALVIAVDNTAAIGAINARHSGNSMANEFIRRIDQALTANSCTLDIVPVTSRDNAADAASRGRANDKVVSDRCMRVMLRHEVGLTRVEVPTSSHPTFSGDIRHSDFEEDDDITVWSLQDE